VGYETIAGEERAGLELRMVQQRTPFQVARRRNVAQSVGLKRMWGNLHVEMRLKSKQKQSATAVEGDTDRVPMRLVHVCVPQEERTVEVAAEQPLAW
jgi:hypothetical protein